MESHGLLGSIGASSACERITVHGLLTQARELYDCKDERLEEKARSCLRYGFRGGAEWMREVLTILRHGQIPQGQANFALLGIIKYTLSFFGLVITIPLLGYIVGLILGGVLFYLIESQMVFLFPCVLDGVAHPFRESRARTVQSGGTFKVMRTVFGLGVVMLLGGCFGYGFVRSWCLGCISILIWYEELRKNKSRLSVISKLEICASNPIQIRVEKISRLGRINPFRILFVSDLHLSGFLSLRVADQVVEVVNQVRPDQIVLGGDLLDSRRGEKHLSTMILQLAQICPVMAIAGNHDRSVGTNFVQSMVEKAGGTWHGDLARLVVRNANSSTGIVVNCVHDPAMFNSHVDCDADIVLAGHLHGGQFVLFQRGADLYPGNLFYRWNRLKTEIDGKIVLVSRGVNDTMPIRWNCPREVILCEVT